MPGVVVLGLRRDLVFAQLFGALGMPSACSSTALALASAAFGIELDFKPGRVNCGKGCRLPSPRRLADNRSITIPATRARISATRMGANARQLPDDRPWDRLNRNHCYLRGRLCSFVSAGEARCKRKLRSNRTQERIKLPHGCEIASNSYLTSLSPRQVLAPA